MNIAFEGFEIEKTRIGFAVTSKNFPEVPGTIYEPGIRGFRTVEAEYERRERARS